MVQLIAQKRDGFPLSNGEIEWIIENYTSGAIPDYQMSALLMSIYLKGFSKSETFQLTKSMLESGNILPNNDASIIDKHSTGGIGDKTSFIVAPIAKAVGVKVPMIAGRGLGHSGGTVDKVEAIKGFKTALSLNEFQTLLQKNGIVMCGQSQEIAPADKKIYALRDVTSTVSSIPLITASIMSKKLAEGAAGIVLDVKYGNGAFMEKLGDAKRLADSMRAVANLYGNHCYTFITDMNQPLGNMVGNALEIQESIETLKGKGPQDLTEICLILSGAMIHLAKKAKSLKEGIKLATQVLENGEALKEFKKLIQNQGGDIGVIDDYNRLGISKLTTVIKAESKGYIKSFDTKKIGYLCIDLGGGRKQISDVLDLGVGFDIHKKVGDAVKKGDTLVTIYHREAHEAIMPDLKNDFLKNVIKISTKKVAKPKLVVATNLAWSKK